MKRILVVDDNIMMRRLIINLFNRDSFAFDEAGDGREGLEKMSNHQYDLVITDIVMPRMEGIEMIIQAKRSFPGVKIIAISGGEPFYLTLAKKLGIQGIFTKPLERQVFLAAVNSNLELKVDS
jgi:two-component system nitrogen regulation response regulator NtrX